MPGADPISVDGDSYVAFLDRQAAVFQAQRRAGLARLDLRPGDAVLDAGCGPGTDSFDIESFVMPGGKVVGVDADKKMIEVARRRAEARQSKVEFSIGDVCRLDYDSNSFDVVRCVLLLLHVHDPEQAVFEMVRVLRPGGRLVCIDVDHQMDAIDATDVSLAERVLRGRFERLRNPRIGRQLRGLLAGAGLAAVDVEVLTQVSTSWDDFNALTGEHRPTVFDFAIENGVAPASEVEALERDLRTRDDDGRFFACAVRMRATGTKPASS